MNTILTSAIVALVLAFLLGLLLGGFKKLFHVDVDPKVTEIREALPGANCGACGYPGCDGFAVAVAMGEAPVTGCTVGAGPVAKRLGEIMGVSASAEKKVALLLCQGTKDVCKDKAGYVGVKTCLAAKISVNGTKQCDWGCIGLGDCQVVCPFDAIHVLEDGLPHVDEEKCTGCGICVANCPQKILTLIPQSRKGSIALCSCRGTNRAAIMKSCKRSCIKCLKCEKACPNGACVVTDGIPKIDYSLCESCGKCVEVCPNKVLILSEHREGLQKLQFIENLQENVSGTVKFKLKEKAEEKIKEKVEVEE